MIGLGNPWRRDDAVGLEVARRTGGTAVEHDPSRLLDLWAGEREVVLVDAVRSGAEPGTIHRLDAAAGPLPAELFGVSTHHVGLAETVELARALGRLPERLDVYGIEGGDFAAGTGLTPAVQRAAAVLAAELARKASSARDARS